MNKLENIFRIAKNLAAILINKNKIDKDELTPTFDSKTSREIIDRLQNSESQANRSNIIDLVNKDKKKDWDKIQKEISPFKIHKLNYVLKVAAIFLIAIGIAYYIKENKPTTPKIASVIKSNQITLKLANGNTKVISTTGETKIINDKGQIIGTQQGSKLNYQNNSTAVSSNQLEYNELRVPYGKTFELILSDGTTVYLNSGTSLKYPTQFFKNKLRTVYLIGEAYFKVAKDKSHPFVVSSRNLNIRVLGTKFNVASYSEDLNINTVLVEGSVALYNKETIFSKEKATLLTPGNKAKWDTENETIRIKKVKTSIYTSWVYGNIVFEHLKFKHILKKLERHYNVVITNTNKKLDEQIFTATFNTETIEEVLNSFQTNSPFNYKKEGDIITIN